MGSNAIIAIVVGAIVVIVGFSLWPVLNGASNNLYSYFRNSCDDGSGNRFTRAYRGYPGPSAASFDFTPLTGGSGGNWPSLKGLIPPTAAIANADINGKFTYTVSSGVFTQRQVGQTPGITTLSFPALVSYLDPLLLGPIVLDQTLWESATSYNGVVQSFVGGSTYVNGAIYYDANVGELRFIHRNAFHPSVGGAASPNEYDVANGIHGGKGVSVTGNGGECEVSGINLPGSAGLYNEQGDLVYTNSGSTSLSDVTIPSPFAWIEVADILKRFSGINNLLLTILPVISIAGFLGVSGAKLYTYGKGASDIGSAISTSIFTLIAIVVAMVIAGPIMGSLVDANQVVESGQYQVNNSFGNIISLLFSMIPIIYVAGLVTLVGLQAKAALMGGKGGGGM